MLSIYSLGGKFCDKEVMFVIAARSTELCPDGLSSRQTHTASHPPRGSCYVRDLPPCVLALNLVITWLRCFHHGTYLELSKLQAFTWFDLHNKPVIRCNYVFQLVLREVKELAHS